MERLRVAAPWLRSELGKTIGLGERVHPSADMHRGAGLQDVPRGRIRDVSRPGRRGVPPPVQPSPLPAAWPSSPQPLGRLIPNHDLKRPGNPRRYNQGTGIIRLSNRDSPRLFGRSIRKFSRDRRCRRGFPPVGVA